MLARGEGAGMDRYRLWANGSGGGDGGSARINQVIEMKFMFCGLGMFRRALAKEGSMFLWPGTTFAN